MKLDYHIHTYHTDHTDPTDHTSYHRNILTPQPQVLAFESASFTFLRLFTQLYLYFLSFFSRAFFLAFSLQSPVSSLGPSTSSNWSYCPSRIPCFECDIEYFSGLCNDVFAMYSFSVHPRCSDLNASICTGDVLYTKWRRL